MAIKTKAQTIEEETKTKQKHKMDRAHRGQARRLRMRGAAWEPYRNGSTIAVCQSLASFLSVA
jgi:hypothetical protein